MSNSVKIPTSSANEFLTALQSIIGGEVDDNILWLNAAHDAGIYDNQTSSYHILSLQSADGRRSNLTEAQLSKDYTITCVYDKSKSGNTVMFGFNKSNTGLYETDTIIIATVGDKIAVFNGNTANAKSFYIYNVKNDGIALLANSTALSTVFINMFSDDIGEAVPEVFELYKAPAARSTFNNEKWQIGEKTVMISYGIGIAID